MHAFFCDNITKIVAIQHLKAKFTVLQGFRLCGGDWAFASSWTFGKISPPYTYGWI